MTDYRSRSMWLDGVPSELIPRPSLPGPVDVDVAVVGAGYTGLWTAYYLKKADPTLRVAVLEKEIAGFGASGRNGGWCHTTFPGSREAAAKTHGRQAVVDQQRVRPRAEVFARAKQKLSVHSFGQEGVNPFELARKAVGLPWRAAEETYVLGPYKRRANAQKTITLG